MLATHSHRYLRKQPIQARSRRTVESILEAADRVLRREGYAAASTNRIAQVAGYSVGSLYQYFADKESVVRTLIDRSLQAEDERIGRQPERGGPAEKAGLDSLQAAIRELVDAQLRGRWNESYLVTVLLEHGAALYGEHPVERVQLLQTATANRLQQLAVEHWSRLRRDEPAAMLWTLGAATQAITLGFAAVAPTDVALGDLARPLGKAFASALSEPLATSGLADELVTTWRGECARGQDRPIAERLPGLRTRLLRGDGPVDPARTAPLAFALSCLPTLMTLSSAARPGVSDEALDRELAVLATALLRAADPRT